MELTHGSNILHGACREFGIAKSRWTVLSTGISRWAWPVPPVPEPVWRAMPDAHDGLEQVAAEYYGCRPEAVLTMPGSQLALRGLPRMIERGRVAISVRGYSEHRVAWAEEGHTVVSYRDARELHRLVSSGSVDHAVVVNPNNPSCEIFQKTEVLSLHETLRSAGGTLVVDEAFADTMPEISVAPLCPAEGLVVLRSVGKFFGLAGIRLGFVLAPPSLAARIKEGLSPWHVAHPARWVGLRALADEGWQVMQRERLEQASRSWLATLRGLLPELRFRSLPLFVSAWGAGAFCEALRCALGQRAVLVRMFESVGGERMLRIGLPRAEEREELTRIVAEAAAECRSSSSRG